MSKELDAIVQFIQQPNTDFAYMLTGAWGSGKTYFWKHIVVPRLSQDHARADDLFAYVSLYGMEKPDEIRSAVFGQLHPRLAKAGKIASLLAPVLGSAIGVSSPEPEKIADTCGGLIDRLDQGKRLIICFDDLERTAIRLDVALGQINQFVEHAGAKVVILCNEAEIRAESRDAYQKTKEKVVRITRVYSGNPMQVLPAIIAEFSADTRYHEFLKENNELIIDLLRRSGLENLRALKYSMLLLQVAFAGLSKLLPQKKAVYREYLKILLSVSFDLHQRKISATDVRSFLTQGSNAIFGAYLGKKEDQPKPLAAFGDRYGFDGIGNKIPTSQALADLIDTGYLDSAKLFTEIDEQNAAQTPGQQAVSALFNGWFELSDDALTGTVNVALDAVWNGEVTSPERLYNLANILDWMGSEGVPGISDGPAQRVFEAGIAKMNTNWEAVKGEMISLEHSPHLQKDERALGKVVRGILLRKNADVKDQKLKSRFDAALQGIARDPNWFSFFLWNEQEIGIGRHAIAYFVTPKALAETIFSASNEVRHAISGAFRLRYSEQYKIDSLVKDLHWLQEFRDIIEGYLARASKATPAGNMHLRWIRDYVQKAILRMRQLDNATLDPTLNNRESQEK